MIISNSNTTVGIFTAVSSVLFVYGLDIRLISNNRRCPRTKYKTTCTGFSRDFPYLNYVHKTEHDNEHAQRHQLTSRPVRRSGQKHFGLGRRPVLQTVDLKIKNKSLPDVRFEQKTVFGGKTKSRVSCVLSEKTGPKICPSLPDRKSNLSPVMYKSMIILVIIPTPRVPVKFN